MAKEFRIRKSTYNPFQRNTYHQVVPVLIQIFRTLKYAQKVDLSKLFILHRHIYLPKILLFMKRLSHSRQTVLSDSCEVRNNYKSTEAPWIKYSKRLDSCSYRYCIYSNRSLFSANYKFDWSFASYLRFQPFLKNLTLEFSVLSTSFLHYISDIFDLFPPTLEKLSLRGLNSDEPFTNVSLLHLKNLKSLELQFDEWTKSEFVVSVLQLLSQLSSHLQSLSLEWVDDTTPELAPTFLALKALNRLTQLKLLPKLRRGQTNRKFMMILDALQDCPLEDLSLVPSIDSEEDLDLIKDFVKRFGGLESLKLKIDSMKLFSKDLEKIKGVLGVIDDLALLRKFFVSITAMAEKKNYLPELNPVFTKIFTKAVPLESFRVEITPLESGKQTFLGMLESLKRVAPSLKKLRIDLGEYKPQKNEFETILNFVRSLESIRSLRLASLNVPVKQFFIDLTRIVLSMPYLRTFTVGEVKGVINQPTFMNIVEEILQKKGLKTFDCQVSDEFRKTISKNPKICPKIDVEKLIKNKNDCLRNFPSLPIYGNYQGLFSEYKTWE